MKEFSEKSNCPLCDAPSRHAYKPKDYEHGVTLDANLRSCRECDLLFLFPLPHPNEIGRLYPKDYYSFGDGSNMIQKIMNGYNWLEAKRLARRLRDRKNFLDVGCGDGAFLSHLHKQKSWKVLGIEQSIEAVERAKAQGLPVLQKEIDQLQVEEPLDVIRMNHIIEHFVSPLAALQSSWKLLKPGGLIIGETPNADCMDYRIFRKYWGGLHFPRHLWLFSHRSIKKIAERSGFELVETKNCYRTVGWSAGVQNWLVEKLNLAPPKGGRFFWYPLLIIAFLPFTFFQSLFGKTGVMEFTLRKPQEV